MKAVGKRKKYNRTRLMAIMLSMLMVFTLFGDVGYMPVADDATETTAANFMDVVNSITVTPSSSSTDKLDMDKALNMHLVFTLPDDGDTFNGKAFDIKTDYLFSFDLNSVKAEGNGANQAVSALVTSQNESNLPIVMGGQIVGRYSINGGVVTLDFSEGITILEDSTISRMGTFDFSCSLNQDAFANEGGEYVLKFDTATSTINPTIYVDEKDFIKAGVTVDKQEAVFDAATKTATYTIVVNNTSGSELSNLVISDTMGSNLTYVQGSVSNGIVESVNGQNITFTMATVPTGETTFTYTCNVTDGAFTGANSVNGGASGTDNTITATLNGDNIFLDNSSKKNDSTSISVKKDIVDKIYNGYDSTTGTASWTIVINGGSDTFDLGGYKFTDTLDNELEYVQNSIKITGDTTNTSVIAGLTNVITGNATEYEFPAGTTGQYTITYETTVPEHDGKVSYDNEAKITNDTYSDTDKVYTDPIGDNISGKAFAGDAANLQTDANGDLIIPWATTIKVPIGTDTMSYTDYVNTWYDENGLGFYTTTADDNGIFTITYSGTNSGTLAVGTDYTVVKNSDTSYTVNFTIDGLNKVNDGNTTITISYSTIGNYANKPSDSGSKYRNHYNLSVSSSTTSLNESGSAETQYTPTTLIDKSVASFDAENRTITWAIKVNASSANVLKDLVLTDTISNMRYWGYKNGDVTYEHDYDAGGAFKAYVVASNYQSYTLDIKETKTANYTEDNPEYEYVIDFTDGSFANANVWDQSTAITDPTALEQSFTIYYTTKIEGENLYSNNTTTYKNNVSATATVNDNPNPTTSTDFASQTLTAEILTKECAQTTDDGVAVLTYTIEVNPDGLKLNPDADEPYYIVEDTLPASLVYMPAKTVVVDSETGETIALAGSAETVKSNDDGSLYHVSYTDNVLTFTVPDSRPLTITYKVTMLSDSSAGGVTYINSVKLARPYVSNESLVSNQTYKSVASSAANMVGRKLFIVDKVDALDTTNHLSGAKFEATEYEYDTNSSQWVESGNVFEGTTGTNGTVGADAFTVKDGSADPNATISTNKIYVITETVAPYGYEVTTKQYKIIVLDSDNPIEGYKIPSDTYRITAGTTLLFSDMPATVLPENMLTITKEYYEADGVTPVASQAEKAVIEIYEGELNLEQCKSGSYTPLATGNLGNGFTYNKSGDIITLELIPDGTYTVYEKSAPTGYDILTNVYHFTVSNYLISWENEAGVLEASATIKNKKTFENELTINKEYYSPSGTKLDVVDVPENAVFTYQQTAYYDSQTQGYVDIANGVVTTIPTTDNGLTYTIETLPAGKYIIKEASSNVYETNTSLPITVIVDANGNIAVSDKNGVVLANGTNVDVEFTVENYIKDNKITVNKAYYDESGTLIDASTIPETLTTGDAATTNQQKVIFTLYKKDASGNYVEAVLNTDYKSTSTAFAVSGTSTTDAYIWATLEPGDYRLVETLVETPVEDVTKYETLHTVSFTVNTDYSITTNTSPTGSYEQLVNVDNRALDATACRFYLTKYVADQAGNLSVDTAGNVFTFKMEKSDGNSWTEVGTGVFGYNVAKQRWEATGLGAGTYRVVEDGQGTNYKNAGVITIVIELDANQNANVITSITYSGDAADFWTTSVSENIQNENIDTVVANLINRPEDNSITVTKEYYQPDGTTVAYPANHAQFTLYKKIGNDYVVVETLKTDGNNQYIFDKLDAGDYKISETYTPTGYVKASDVEFTVASDYTIDVTSATDTTISVASDGTLLVSVIAKNVISNSFTWTKKYTDVNGNEITDTTDRGALFGDTEFTVYNEAGNAVVSGVTVVKDAAGYKFTVSNLNNGVYRLRETTTPAGYITAGDIVLTVTGGKIGVTYDGIRTDFTDLLNNNTHNATATLYNRQDTNQLVITKEYYQADGTTQIPLNQVLAFASFKIVDDAGNEVTGVTKQFSQSTGTYVFSNIPQGSYKIVETPMSGYATIGELSFTVDVNGKINYTEGTGWEAGVDDAIQASVTAKNTKVPNGFTLRKLYYNADGTDITNNVTTHAEFKLVATDGSNREYTLTRTNNIYSVENIPYGVYELRETVPAGYEQVTGTITVNIAENGTITATYSGNADDFHATNAGTTEDMEILFINHETANSFTVNKTYVSYTGEDIAISDLEASEFASFALYAYYGTGYEKPITDSSKVKFDKTKGVYTFTNLDAGEYTIVESAGVGFSGAGNITFTVNADKTITNVNGATTTANSDNYHKFVEIENERAPFDNGVAVTKTFINVGGQDVTDDTMLQNTNFVMKDSDGNVVGGFVYDTTYKCWIIQNLEPGKYVISEVDTPDGYVAVSDIIVTVTKTAPEVTEVTMSYTGMNAGDVTCEYGTTQDPTDTRYMEIKAVNRQEVDNKFVIDKKFISVYGKEITSANVLATYLKSTQFTYKAEGGTNVANIPYDSVSGQYVLEDLQPGTYIISETPHNDFIAISDIKLVVNNDGSLNVTYDGDNGDIVVTESQTEVNSTTVEVNNYSISQFLNISKVDITNGDELSGAKLTITNEDGKVIEEWTSSTGVHKMAVGGFIPDKEYTLTEVTAPYGYDIAESIVFKTDDLGNIYVKATNGTFKLVTDNTIVMEDAPKYVTISKVDLVNGNELPEAKLTITDKDGKVVDTWTSTTTPHQMLMTSFTSGVEYTLTEVTAPDGYEVAESIIFKIDASGTIYIKSADGTFTKLTANMIVMKDSPSATSSSAVETGDNIPIVLLFILVMLSGLGIIYMMPKKRRR